ncbi:hypothetical protein DM826_07150 [Halonotius aquaticus]|uniref:Glycosyltransferase 2-like domain-containing protein n=1 Tax=Halonotius aquaticus TaxID=2216978 RepID=A0A3A6Q8G9_9EURY|nr:glycosyltransferase [Halonotius aquaticus]RJX43377.1 hypothetical protein DM826_07150 [Halonotius aquaticus]
MTEISIALPTYNGGRYLRTLIDSLLDQTRLPDEIVVCDDNSTDGTVLIAKEYQKEYPDIFNIYENSDNVGAFKNFERAFRNCSGDFIAVCDQDDYWKKTKIEKQERRLESNRRALLCYHNSEFHDQDLESMNKYLWDLQNVEPSSITSHQKLTQRLAQSNFIQGASMMFRKSLLETVLPVPRKVPYDYWIAIVSHCFGPVEIIDESLIKWRRHPNTDTSTVVPNDSYFHQFIKSIYDITRTPIDKTVQHTKEWENQMNEFVKRFDELNKNRFCVDPYPIKNKLIRRKNYYSYRTQVRTQPINKSVLAQIVLFKTGLYHEFGNITDVTQDVFDLFINRWY